MHSDRVQQLSDAGSEFRNDEGLLASACNEAPTVFIVDGKASVREGLERVIRAAGWRVRLFSSAMEFLTCARGIGPGCLVLDSVLPDTCGLELQDRLNRSDAGLSIVFVTGQPDVPTAVRAMRAGAVGVLTTPVDDQALLSTIEEAIQRSRTMLDTQSSLVSLRRDYSSLSKREREVMTLVVSGLLNKQVGFQLGISEITVKAHRGQVMRKMKARSFADLVNKAHQLGQAPH